MHEQHPSDDPEPARRGTSRRGTSRRGPSGNLTNRVFAGTAMGRRATRLAAACLVLIGIFTALVIVGGERGGDTFFSNTKLTVPFLAAIGSAMAGGAVAAVAIVRGDRTVLVWLALALGIFVAWFAFMEIAFPH